jgi:hypothetical protein
VDIPHQGASAASGSQASLPAQPLLPYTNLLLMIWGALGIGLQPILGGLSAIKALKYPPQPACLPTGHSTIPPTSPAEVDAALARLDPGAWVATPAPQRAQLLQRCLRNCVSNMERLATLGVAAKGSYGLGAGEEM